ncbi:MAG: hypothetical protein KDE53_17260, partial [Caldilineaceae bacterium]|nr:hypothetical protein [Caldilineaceae bacterium]
MDRLSAQVEAQIRETEQVLAKRGIRPRLLQLAANFGLDRTALDILLLCIAPAFDTKYERLYGYLKDNVTRRRPSVRLILDLLGAPGVEKLTLAAHLQEEAPLFRQVLLSFVVESPPANAHWLNQTLQPSETVVAWLRGYYQPDPKLVGHITVNRCEPKERGAAREACADAIQDYPWLPQLQHSCGADAPILVITGTDGEKQHTFAAQIAMLCDASLLTADLSKIIGEECTPLEALHLVLRDATMTGSLPFLSGWDRCLIHGQVDTAIIAMLCQHSGPVIVGCNNPWLAGGIERQRPFYLLAMALPEIHQRLALWQHHVAVYGKQATQSTQNGAKNSRSATVRADHLADLAGQFVLNSGQIRDAVLAACDRALQAGCAITPDDLYWAARRFSNPKLGALAHKIEPRYSSEDLVLPTDEIAKLEEIVTTVRQRRRVLEDHPKLAPSTGIMTLFAGPPGTGK